MKDKDSGGQTGSNSSRSQAGQRELRPAVSLAGSGLLYGRQNGKADAINRSRVLVRIHCIQPRQGRRLRCRRWRNCPMLAASPLKAISTPPDVL